MPQMPPLMWLNLMIMFSIILMLTNPINFFYKMEKMLPMKKQMMMWPINSIKSFIKLN